MSKFSNLVAIFGSQGEIARAAGVTRALLTRWARSGRVPTQYNHKILDAADQLGLDRAMVAACLDEHVCPCCGQPLEPGAGINVMSSAVRKAVKEHGE
jgi:hypothetical protein